MRNRSWQIIAVVVAIIAVLLTLFAFERSGPDGTRLTFNEKISRVVHSFGSRIQGMTGDRRSKASRAKRTVRPADTRAKAAQTTFSVAGLVTNDDGKVIPGAKVTLRGQSPGKPVTTDREGRFALLAPGAGVYDVAADHPQYVAVVIRKLELSAQNRRIEVTIRLPLGATVNGRVLDTDGKPIEGARISSHRRKLEQMSEGGNVFLDDASYKTAETSSTGEFILTGIGLGATVVDCVRAGYDPSNRETNFNPDTVKRPLEIKLTKSGVLAGAVIDEDNNPVSSATVRLTRYRGFGERPQDLQPGKFDYMTTASGQFAFGKLFTEGFYDLRVDSPNYATAIFVQVPVGTDKLACTLEHGGAIEGHAVYIDRSTSASKLELVATAVINGTTFTMQTGTNEDGSFAYEHLPYGRYSIDSGTPGIAAEPLNNVPSTRDRRTTNVLVQLYEAATAEGHVYESGIDVPVEAATVTVQSSYGPYQKYSRTFRTTTDRLGHFRLSRLPGGFHIIKAAAKSLLSSASGTSAQTFTAQPGERINNLVLRLTQGGSVEGYVSAPDGSKVDQADVQLFGYRSGQLIDAKTLHSTTDISGYFRIWGIEIGDGVQLNASIAKAGYAKTRSNTIELTQDNPQALVNVVMKAGAAIAGKVTDTANRPLADAEIKMTSREFAGDPTPSVTNVRTGVNGVYLAEHLPGGRVLMVVTRRGYVQQSKEITVTDGRVTPNVNFKMTAGNGISGRVITFENKPVPNAKLTASPLSGATGYATATSDKNGDFFLRDVGKGFFQVDAVFTLQTSDGTQSYTFTQPRVASGASNISIDCDLANNVAAHVEGDERTAISNFKLSLRSRTNTQPPQDFRFNLDRSYTKAGGFFRVLNLPRGVYAIEITSPGYETYKNDNMTVGPGKRTVWQDIRFHPSANVTGVLISSTTSRPVNNATVRVLDASKQDYAIISSGDLSSSMNKDVAQVLDPDSLDSLNPAYMQNRTQLKVRANVVATGKSDYTGTFNVGGTASGTYTVEIEHPDYISARLPGVSLLAKDVTDLGQIYMDPGGGLTGRVTDDSGNPLVSASVQVLGVDPDKLARTDSGGNYRLRGVPPGQWTVLAKSASGMRASHAFALTTIQSDETAVLNLQLDTAAQLRCAMQGAGVKSASGRLYAIGPGAQVFDSIYYGTTWNGRELVASGIPTGTYFLRATGSAASGSYIAWRVVDLDFGPNTTGLQVPSADVRGQVLQRSGEVGGKTGLQAWPIVQGVSLPQTILAMLVKTASSGTNGIFRLGPLQAGGYRVNYLPPGSGAWISLPPFAIGEGERLQGSNITLP